MTAAEKEEKLPTPLLIWRHSHLIPLQELDEELQDRVLILRNHPNVCAMSYNTKLISYSTHRDFLRNLSHKNPSYDSCALYCEPISQLPGSQNQDPKRAEQGRKSASVIDADYSLAALRPVVGVVSIDLRLPQRPLIGLYKNLYHYTQIHLGFPLLFAAMLRASQIGLRQVFLECYSCNLAMQRLAQQAGFMRENPKQHSLVEAESERGPVLSFERYIPAPRKLLREPAFAQFLHPKLQLSRFSQ